MRDEQSLRKQLKKLLDHDPSLSRYGINVQVNGDFVVLQGVVDVLADKRYAEEVVRSVPGVATVENGLTICTDGAIDDEDVAFEVAEELRADPAVPASIGPDVHSGRVRLVGSAENRRQVDAAINDAEKARGVVDVISHVHVREPGWWDAESDERHDQEPKVSAGDGVVIGFFDRIGADPYLNEAGLNCYWEKGQLVIEGEVESVDAKKSLEHVVQDLIHQAPRRFMVENRVRVETE